LVTPDPIHLGQGHNYPNSFGVKSRRTAIERGGGGTCTKKIKKGLAFLRRLCYNINIFFKKQNIRLILAGGLQGDGTLENPIQLGAAGASESETLRQKDKDF